MEEHRKVHDAEASEAERAREQAKPTPQLARVEVPGEWDTPPDDSPRGRAASRERDPGLESTPHIRGEAQNRGVHSEGTDPAQRADTATMPAEPAVAPQTAEKPRLTGRELAQRAGLPEAEPGYRWVADPAGEWGVRYDRNEKMEEQTAERPSREFVSARDSEGTTLRRDDGTLRGEFRDRATDTLPLAAAHEFGERRTFETEHFSPESNTSERIASRLETRDTKRDVRDGLLNERTQLRAQGEDLSAEQAQQLSDARRDIGEQSRQIGEVVAAQHVMEHHQDLLAEQMARERGGHADDYRALVKESYTGLERLYPPPRDAESSGRDASDIGEHPSRPGEFDQVWRVKGAEGIEDRFIVVEAKGGDSELGTRVSFDDNENRILVEQGSTRYFEDVTDEMMNSDDDAASAAGHMLSRAFEDRGGRVTYMEVHTPIQRDEDGHGKVNSYRARYFTL